jgi:hypothetical protein
MHHESRRCLSSFCGNCVPYSRGGKTKTMHIWTGKGRQTGGLATDWTTAVPNSGAKTSTEAYDCDAAMRLVRVCIWEPILEGSFRSLIMVDSSFWDLPRGPLPSDLISIFRASDGPSQALPISLPFSLMKKHPERLDNHRRSGQRHHAASRK